MEMTIKNLVDMVESNGLSIDTEIMIEYKQVEAARLIVGSVGEELVTYIEVADHHYIEDGEWSDYYDR